MLYRLKSEAVPFFKEKYATSIKTLSFWEEMGVDQKALETVEECHIKYGHKTSESCTSLSGWDENGSHYHFTVYFPSAKHKDHDKFSNGKTIRGLMDKIQNQINDFYLDFSS